MIDLAVGVVIGAAFGKVIDSLVKNIFMPLISYITPNMNYADWHIGKVAIGLFVSDVISFLIIALAVFIVIVKLVGYLMRLREKPAEPAAPPPLSTQEQLLMEIRDLLRARPS
jgi:large conductance mechanosensitive channel